MRDPSANNDRYSRQVLFAPVGEKGQEQIRNASIVIIGCGALGTGIANNLARAGVGRIKIVDRDFVETSNLQRQCLFDEDDARQHLPKAVAAVERLKRINSTLKYEAVVADVNRRNIEQFIEGASLVLDATDNMETRFLLNDACIKASIPWVYGGAVGSTGMVLPIIPHQTACLRCCLEDLPPPGTLETCDRAGVLNSVCSVVASLQSAVALQFLVGGGEKSWPLTHIDVWEWTFRNIQVERREDCPACGAGRFDFLEGKEGSHATNLCGRNMVQIVPTSTHTIPLEKFAETLAATEQVSFNGFMLTVDLGQQELILFPDGRALVKGTADESLARSLYAKYVGT